MLPILDLRDQKSSRTDCGVGWCANGFLLSAKIRDLCPGSWPFRGGVRAEARGIPPPGTSARVLVYTCPSCHVYLRASSCVHTSTCVRGSTCAYVRTCTCGRTPTHTHTHTHMGTPPCPGGFRLGGIPNPPPNGALPGQRSHKLRDPGAPLAHHPNQHHLCRGQTARAMGSEVSLGL